MDDLKLIYLRNIIDRLKNINWNFESQPFEDEYMIYDFLQVNHVINIINLESNYLKDKRNDIVFINIRLSKCHLVRGIKFK